ncbi:MULTISPECIES: TetR/AcrR family transcriptional regulator [unclassified Pseudomonas]|uniref:TetR/AcrR family transcriptional regulator n=1 Tax=unclassified Pseudomonas TaxID=196821 RepID=UPI001F445DF8|nr:MULTISPECIES: TetR/AcrR family transcriptional regulator [unclassified Pseudomonas]MCF5231314.1 TetR family transcriptional regulator [Pseudomonas sp. PA-5-4H]MCF5235778.1 TetR family transcriptional regulator [Pseudomonas sp. PA-5-4G]MCF5248821.1 TetR family transcriptional regulator [Pseudomonas sp. PA-5-4B]MCF5253813.1 TetR family transcriptional regulator [Pseudomonas sp. PA-5-4B]MCF5258477.1 TetR family transcriptional regulator [Pseudomonas sp. PA-5-4A]
MSDKKAQTRERILQAASAALIQRGPAEPSVGEVMGAAGLTVGGFYAHFESKDALMLEAFTQLLARRRASIDDMDAQLTGEERRSLVAAFYLSRKHRDSTDHACPIPATVGEMSRLPDEFRLALNEHTELMAAQLAASPEDTDKALADMALMIGGLALARALGSGELSDRVLRAAKSAVR